MKIKFIMIVINVISILAIASCNIESSFPVYRQNIPAECGSTCLQMICKYYGKEFDREHLNRLTKTNKDKGVSMLGIYEAAEVLGFKTMGVRITYEKLKREVPLPCIVHWEGDNFIVVYDILEYKSGDLIFTADPAWGLIKYKQKEFCDSWFEKKKGKEKWEQGLALLLVPTPKFHNNQPY
jgi:ATP-binding cassette, subfamily B, bacterial